MFHPKIALTLALSAMLTAAPGWAQAGSGSSREVPVESAPTCTRCGERTFGTSIEWAGSVPEAAQRAQAEEKLVFVLHVSGHFENPGYT